MSIVGVGRNILDAARELDFQSIEREIRYPIRVLVAGRNKSDIDYFVSATFGSANQLAVQDSIQILELDPVTRPSVPERIDLAIVVLREDQEADAVHLTLLSALRAYAIPTFIVSVPAESNVAAASNSLAPWFPEVPSNRVIRADLVRPDTLRQRLVSALATLDRHQLTPLAHRFIPLREPLVEVLIRDSSRVNGQFALVSSLPSLVPVIGGLVSSVADLFVLTKNQVTLVFRIAGIYGRDVTDRTRIAVEIAPVVGSAFLWRTVARSLVGLLPGAISAVPKTLVAYVGTYVVGEIAHFYYREGRRPPPEILDQIRRDGLRLARKIFSRD